MKNDKKVPRNLNESEVNEILKITPDNITKQTVIDLFANYEDSPSKFQPSDKFILRKEIVNGYAKEDIIKEDIHTTVGRYLINSFLLFSNPKILKKIGYINETLNKEKIASISNQITQIMLDEVITVEEVYDYFNRLNWFGFTLSSFTTPSINVDMIITPPAVEKRKRELLREHEEELKNGNPIIASEIEQELITIAKENLKDNPGRDLYDSGAKVNWGNQYKNMNIMGGPTINNETGGYRIVTNSLIDGLSKEDIAAQGDSLVTGVYSRAVNTQTSGYEGKKLLSAMQNIVLDKEGSDCGSKDYFKIILTEDNMKYFVYRYIKGSNNELICLTPDIIQNYLGKVIYLRTVLYCKGDKICEKCAGSSWYKLGIKNLGMTCNKLATISLNLSLKKFHDQSLHTKEFDYKEYFS